MSLPLSGQISMDDIRNELGVPSQSPFGLDEARSGTYRTINSCSTYKPPSSGPISLSDWYGYNQSQSCGPTYDFYLANEYTCFPCTLNSYSVPVAFPSGTAVSYTKYYNDLSFDGFVYKLQSTTSYQTAIILTTIQSNASCNSACSV
jgi:hypothetical protein